MAKFTFLANQPGLVQIGTIMDLSASKTDPSGVEGSVDGKPVGIISNDPNLAFGKKSAPAKKIRESVIDHPQCASAHGLVLSCKTQQNRQNKTLDYLYETELYVVPKRTANKSEKTDSLQYLVGGRSVTNPKKAELIGQLQALKNDGKPIAVRVQILRIGTTYSVVLPENPVAGASAGTIKTPDDILSQLVQDGETYPAAVVALAGTTRLRFFRRLRIFRTTTPSLMPLSPGVPGRVRLLSPKWRPCCLPALRSKLLRRFSPRCPLLDSPVEGFLPPRPAMPSDLGTTWRT